MTYRRLDWSDVWHWCGNCSHVTRYRRPASVWRTRNKRPKTDLCNECKSKERRAACDGSDSNLI